MINLIIFFTFCTLYISVHFILMYTLYFCTHNLSDHITMILLSSCQPHTCITVIVLLALNTNDTFYRQNRTCKQLKTSKRQNKLVLNFLHLSIATWWSISLCHFLHLLYTQVNNLQSCTQNTVIGKDVALSKKLRFHLKVKTFPNFTSPGSVVISCWHMCPCSDHLLPRVPVQPSVVSTCAVYYLFWKWGIGRFKIDLQIISKLG